MTATDITPVVLLTGPTRGLGRALLDRLARHPARPRLVLAGRDPVALDAAAARARCHGSTVRTVLLDLADLDAVAAAGDEVARAVGTAPSPR